MTQFKDRLTRFEFWSAMAMLPLHCVLLPRLLLVLNNVLNLGLSQPTEEVERLKRRERVDIRPAQDPCDLVGAGVDKAYLRFLLGLSGARFNLLYYCMSFALVLVLLGRYLLRSWRNLAENPGLCLMHFLTAWGLCLALNFAVNLLMLLISPSGSNPNQDTVNSLTAQDRSTMMAVAVLLAPVVEEAIFRGGIFCTIRRRSRIAAYVVTVLVFGLYHIASYIVSSGDLRMLIYVIQYIPGGVALCWSYDKSGSIWTAIFFHMSYNFVSMM